MLVYFNERLLEFGGDIRLVFRNWISWLVGRFVLVRKGYRGFFF